MSRIALFSLRLLGVFLLFLHCACHSTPPLQTVPNPATKRILSAADSKKPKRLELYFDGTANDWKARTNVRRRFEVIASTEDPKNPCCYVEGVGVRTLSGKVFGVGVKDRVLYGYNFMAMNWKPGDKVMIFGFSRGAFEARLLCGMLAHCGLPNVTKSKDGLSKKELNRIWDYCCKELTDPLVKQPTPQQWMDQLTDNRQATAKRFPHYAFSNPAIDLLAVWDTVPGPLLSKLDDYGTPHEGEGQKYKLRPYPNMKVIMHALALDEKRSQFKPLLVGPPLNPATTKVYEVWFPGAHSDIGGGYSDSNDMAGISFNWVHKAMVECKLTTRPNVVYADACSIMHHPEKTFFNRLSSKELARLVPEGSLVDRSLFARANGEDHLEETDTTPVYRNYAPVIHVDLKAGGTKEVPVPSLRGRTRADQAQVLAPLLRPYDTEADFDRDKSTTGKPLEIQDMKVDTVVTEAPPAPEAHAKKADVEEAKAKVP